MDTIHRSGTVVAEELALITGKSTRTIKKYLSTALDANVIIPSWLIERIGLNNLYQIIIENKTINHKLAKYLEILPKVYVMKSREMSRYLVYLPSVAMKKLEHHIVDVESKNGAEILWRGEIDADSSYTRRVDIKEICELMEKKKQ